jgi:hypothetical protein
LIDKIKKINLKIVFLTNLKTQDSYEEDIHLFQADHQAFQDLQAFLILHTDIFLLHIPIYQFIMEPMEDIC